MKNSNVKAFEKRVEEVMKQTFPDHSSAAIALSDLKDQAALLGHRGAECMRYLKVCPTTTGSWTIRKMIVVASKGRNI